MIIFKNNSTWFITNWKYSVVITAQAERVFQQWIWIWRLGLATSLHFKCSKLNKNLNYPYFAWPIIFELVLVKRRNRIWSKSIVVIKLLSVNLLAKNIAKSPYRAPLPNPWIRISGKSHKIFQRARGASLLTMSSRIQSRPIATALTELRNFSPARMKNFSTQQKSGGVRVGFGARGCGVGGENSHTHNGDVAGAWYYCTSPIPAWGGADGGEMGWRQKRRVPYSQRRLLTFTG